MSAVTTRTKKRKRKPTLPEAAEQAHAATMAMTQAIAELEEHVHLLTVRILGPKGPDIISKRLRAKAKARSQKTVCK